MRTWELNTVLNIYALIMNGRKTYDTRVPDPSKPNKRINEAEVGDRVVIVPVGYDFNPLELPRLTYSIADIKPFKPEDTWQSTIISMLNSIGLEKVFPSYSLDEVIEMYEEWSLVERINKYGIVAIGLGKRLA